MSGAWCRSDENGKLAANRSERERDRVRSSGSFGLIAEGYFFSLRIVSFVIMGCSAECCDSAECSVYVDERITSWNYS